MSKWLGSVAAGRGLLAVALGVLVTARVVQARSMSPAEWSQALGSYTQDPYHHRRTLLRLRHRATADVPSVYVLALADAQLRAHRFDDARRSFTDALGRGLEEPWASWAQVGLGWTALAADDLPGARAEFAVAAGREGPTAGLASLAVALLDAADGKPGAEARFASLATAPGAGDLINRAARLGKAYAAYWNGSYERAARAFEEAADDPRAGPLRDDALYGAAWARAHAGDAEKARVQLEELADSRRSHAHASRAMVNLEPQALVREGIERYRRAPVRAPEEQVTALFDNDGVALAQAALTWMAQDEASGHPVASREPLALWQVHAAQGAKIDTAADSSGRTEMTARGVKRPRTNPNPAPVASASHATPIAFGLVAIGVGWWLGQRRTLRGRSGR